MISEVGWRALVERLERLEDRVRVLRRTQSELRQEIQEQRTKITESHPEMRQIIDACCEHFGVERKHVLSPRRSQKLVDARHAAMLLGRELTSLTLPTIGRILNRDHSSVMHGIASAQKRVAGDGAYAAAIETLRERLKPNQASS